MGAVACYKLHKLEKRNTVQEVKEENKMMEFILTMAVIAFIFVAASVLVALIAGALMKAKNAVFNREAGNASPE
jgi:hypothetical protein